jgi:hypothetical protein
MRDRLQTVGQRILAGQDRDDAGQRPRPRGLDGADARMSVRRPHHMGVRLARHGDVVAVAAFAGQQAQVFLARKRLPDASRRNRLDPVHVPSLGSG